MNFTYDGGPPTGFIVPLGGSACAPVRNPRHRLDSPGGKGEGLLREALPENARLSASGTCESDIVASSRFPTEFCGPAAENYGPGLSPAGCIDGAGQDSGPGGTRHLFRFAWNATIARQFEFIPERME